MAFAKKELENKSRPFQIRQPSREELESIVFGGSHFSAETDGQERGLAPLASNVNHPRVRTLTSREKKKRKGRDWDESTRVDGPAWVDKDDANLEVDLKASLRSRKLRTFLGEMNIKGDEYEKRLRTHFQKLHGVTTWAERLAEKAIPKPIGAFSDDEEGNATLCPSSAKRALKSVGFRLAPTQLEVESLKGLQKSVGNDKEGGQCVIQALEFHSNSELLMTAGRDKTLRLYTVDGETNPKVSSHFFDKFPILGAKFMPLGDQVVMCGMDQRMFGLDIKTGQSFRIRNFDAQNFKRLSGPFVLPSVQTADGAASAPSRASQLYGVTGDAGVILLCDIRTKLPVRTLRMTCSGTAADFSADREVLYSADFERHVYEWDLGTGRCACRTTNEHARGAITSLAVSRRTALGGSPMLAMGAVSGEIDLFDVSGPKLPATPTKTIDNLLTRIAGVRFHPEGELLAGFSEQKKLALRLVHMGTSTVFANWPHSKAPLDKVSAISFSSRHGYMAVGNERGRVLLYRLRHYEPLS